MATFTRANAWNNGGTFDNPDLLWYAKGVGAMQGRGLDDTSSWWFYAAIHGEYVGTDGFPGWGSLPATPAVPNTPSPSDSVTNQYWDQCQHGTWFFLPWHRGYLMALEAQVRADVINLGGPSTWALPYWDYFGPGNNFQIPPAFTQQNLPDGTANPLFVTGRYGPDGDGNIFVPTPAGIQQFPNDPNLGQGTVTQDCLSNDLFTGDDSNTPPPGFGGPQTGFSHTPGTFGNIESNPHNLVHVYVGGSSPDGNGGLMSDPGLAGLDPIFYLHHANIDRMWAAWNSNSANTNPTDPNWLNGPAATGDREFVLPNPDGSAWVYTPQQMSDMSQLNYAYDSLPAVPAAPNALAGRLARLGLAAAAASVSAGASAAGGGSVELLGANEQPLAITGAGASTSVKVDQGVSAKVSASFAAAAETKSPDRVYLNLENVRGTHDASALSVYINLPNDAKPGEHPELLAGTVALFGLRRASLKDGQHGGEGLNFVLDITKIVDELHLQNALNTDAIHVRIVPHWRLPDAADISIGRVSIYRQGQ